MAIIRFYPTLVLLLATMFFAFDIVADLFDGSENAFHLVIECLVFVAVSVGFFLELRRVQRLRRKVSLEQNKTARLSGELLEVMQNQFAEWGLSPTEAEVALFLIKGLSMREISQARHVKEKTIRQQAASVYAKSGYAGRHELAAHFIEDLMSQSTAGSQPL